MILNNYVIKKIKELDDCKKECIFYDHYIGNIDDIKNLKIEKINEYDLKEIGLDNSEIEKCLSDVDHKNKLFEFFFENNDNINFIKLDHIFYYDFISDKRKHADMIYYNIINKISTIAKFLIELYNGKYVFTFHRNIKHVIKLKDVKIVKMFLSKLDIDRLLYWDKVSVITSTFEYRDFEFSKSLINSCNIFNKFPYNNPGNTIMYIRYCKEAIKYNFTEIINLVEIMKEPNSIKKLSRLFSTRKGFENDNMNKDSIIWIIKNLNINTRKKKCLLMKRCDINSLKYIFENNYFDPDYDDIMDIIEHSLYNNKLDVIKYIDHKILSKYPDYKNGMWIKFKANKEQILKKIILTSLEKYQLDTTKYIFTKYPYLKKRRLYYKNDLLFINRCVSTLLMSNKCGISAKIKCMKYLYNIDNNIKIRSDKEIIISKLILNTTKICEKLILYLIEIDPKINFDVVLGNMHHKNYYENIIDKFKKHQKECLKN